MRLTDVDTGELVGQEGVSLVLAQYWIVHDFAIY